MGTDDKSAATASHSDLAFTRESAYGTLAEPTYAGALSFLRRRYSKDLDGVDVAVVGVPFDLATTNRPGARLGPRAIRAASASLAWCRPYAWDFDPFERGNVIDWGDVFFDPGKPQLAPDADLRGLSRLRRRRRRSADPGRRSLHQLPDPAGPA